jgi:hypothetical protein
MDSIQTFFYDICAGMKDSTKRSYVSALRSVCKYASVNPEPKAIGEKHSEIIKILDHFKEPTKRMYLSSIIKFCDGRSSDEAMLAFKKEFDTLRQSISKEQAKQVATEKFKELQEEEFTWKSVLAVRDELERTYHKALHTVCSLHTREVLWGIQQYIILCCYTMIEPRRSTDYTEFVLKNPDPEKDNYLMQRDGNYFFVFNNYKTAKLYGKQEVSVPDKLADIINQWSLICNSRYLLMKYKRNIPFDNVSMCHLLYEVFSGRKVSVNLLRHLYLAQFQQQDAKMSEIAHNMGHSTRMQHLYIYQPQVAQSKDEEKEDNQVC